MSHLPQTLSDKALQSTIRHALRHCSDFRIEHDLPDEIREKLQALDRATAEKTSPIPAS